MKSTRPTAAQLRWRRSPEFRRVALKSITRWNCLRVAAAKCGARRKQDGEPCQNLPLENGRCRFHGGLTPRGDQWHKSQRPSSPKKLQRKLADWECRAKKRAARLARMTPEERKQHERWHRTHKPGSAEVRAAQRIRRRQDAEARWLIESLQKAAAESDPSIAEYAARDRRWCQGNLQHLKVLSGRGLHWVSRLHFFTGIGAYLTAPMWLIFLLTGIFISLQAHFIRPEYFAKGFSLFPQWPEEDPIRAAWVFVGTIGILIAPKLFGLFVALVHGRERRGFGGAFAGVASVLLEIVLSGLIAPIMMLLQTQAVVDVVLGRDAGWQVQRRDDGSLTRSELVRSFGKLTLIGILLGVAAFSVSLSLFLWMAPVTIGLLLAMPLAAWTARISAGQMLRRLRLLLVPEERHVPEVLARANALAAMLVQDGVKISELLRRNARLRNMHGEMLPPPEPSPRGVIDTDLVVAKAKVDVARTVDEAIAFMSSAETRALLSDLDAYRGLLSKPM